MRLYLGSLHKETLCVSWGRVDGTELLLRVKVSPEVLFFLSNR